MDLQASGNSYEIIDIETENLYFVLKGNEDSTGISDNANSSINSYGKNINSSFNRNRHLKEYKDYEIIIISKNNKEIEFYHENINIRNKVTPIIKGKSNLSGVINFRGDIGLTDLIVRVNGVDELKCTLEVFPTKIDYKKDFEAILKDVNEEIYNLAYGFLSRTYLGVQVNDKLNSSKTEFYSILNYVFDNLIRAINIVTMNPHHKLQNENQIVKYNKLKNVTNDTIKWLEKRPHMMGIEALQTKKIITTNTKENGFVKFMLEAIIYKINLFLKEYRKSKVSCDKAVIYKIEGYKRIIKSKLNSHMFRDIKKEYNEATISLVFNMASGYKEIYKYYLMLQKGLSINSNIMSLSMKELSELYEYWCFIKINSLLQKKYKLLTADFLKINKEGINITLRKGSSSLLKYENPRTGEIFKVLYNWTKSSATVSQKPDNILSISKDGSEKAYEFVFDAKYKIDTTEDYIKKYGGVGPKAEDINTMHRYRDSILYDKKKTGQYEHCIFGAFVLFPYNNEEEFKEHSFYKSIEEVNIGAIPFLPSTTGLMEEFLDELINESSYSTFERCIDPIGKENYLNDENFINRNVIVGTLKDSNQFRVSLESNFYHTPKRNVDLIKNKVEYVALSQSIKSFKEDAGILYYGKVKKINEVERSEIIDLPKNSSEIYYLFEIDEWIKLDKKIEVNGYAIRRPFYTSEYLLKRSSSIGELCIKSKEEFRIWQELSRFCRDVSINLRDDKNDKGLIQITSIDGVDVIAKSDEIKIVYNNQVEVFNIDDIELKIKSIIKNIVRYGKRL